MHDFSAVIGKKVNLGAVRRQHFRHRCYAIGGPSGSQHHDGSLRRRPAQRPAGALCHLLAIVGKRAVQVEGYHWIFHEISYSEWLNKKDKKTGGNQSAFHLRAHSHITIPAVTLTLSECFVPYCGISRA